MENEWRNCVAAYVAALSHFIKKSGEFALLSKILLFPCILS